MTAAAAVGLHGVLPGSSLLASCSGSIAVSDEDTTLSDSLSDLVVHDSTRSSASESDCSLLTQQVMFPTSIPGFVWSNPAIAAPVVW
jgi:hypothetical protein